MGVYNSISKKIILPLSDLALGNSVSKNLGFLDRSQWWSRSDLVAWQEERLRSLVTHAYENVPFYRERFDKAGIVPSDIRTREDLKKLPVLTKEEIRSAFPGKIVAQNIPASDRLPGVTSGSTGQPLQYFRIKDSYSMWTACGIRAWNWMGYSLGDRYAKLSQNPRKGFVKKSQDLLNRSEYLFIEHLSDADFELACKRLRRVKPLFIRCYPDPLLFLAKFILKNGIDGINPRAINSTGNTLYPEAREIIEKAFNAPVYDSYSCEGGPNVSQSPGRDVYLSSMEYAISEYLTEDGRDADEGEPGRLVVTDLWNYATPFIRYDSQDILVKSSAAPSCGRGLEPVDRVFGRESDILITPDGRFVIVHIFTIFFERFDSVDRFQAIQDDIDSFRILLVVNDRFDKPDYDMINRYWSDYLGRDSKVSVGVVDKIEPSASGKRRFLIRDAKIPLQLYNSRPGTTGG